MEKTVLYEEHLKLDAKMVEFGGFLMPLEYSSIALEHKAVREACGLFDVCHMGEIYIKGLDALNFVNHLITSDLSNVEESKMLYGLLLNEEGTVIDDLMVYKFSDEDILLVVNASNKDKDYEWILKQKINFDCTVIDRSSEIGLLALQGPHSDFVLNKYTDYELEKIKFFHFTKMIINKKEFLVSRSGYTGEDGFEIYGDTLDVLDLFKVLSKDKDVTLCGLGARDTLRFEAAMPLYGHELSDQISPLEAGLNYAISYNKDFIGKNALLKLKEIGVKRKLVGLELLERGIARSTYLVYKGEVEIGEITTGYMIPNSTKAYALAYIKSENAVLGEEVFVKIRNSFVRAVIRDKKFLEKKYKK